MPVIGLKGIKGGVGTTSIVTGLGWALRTLGEPVLLIDLSPNNLLRLHFNMDYHSPAGWAFGDSHAKDWACEGFHYCKQLDFLPYGSIRIEQQATLEQRLLNKPGLWKDRVDSLIKNNPDCWVLIDIPSNHSVLSAQGITACSTLLVIVNADGQSQALLPQTSFRTPHYFLINKLCYDSSLQKDLSLLWQDNVSGILPMTIHEDAMVMESIARKIPPGFNYSHNLAWQELMALASWCMVYCRDASYA